MKFYEFIEYLQKENPNKVIMVKNGAFFNAIGRDAIILEKVLGFKRTCHSKLLCKCGLPVSYVMENTEKVKNRLKEKNVNVLLFHEVQKGKYKYNDRYFDVLFEVKGEDIKETRQHLDCSSCEGNRYSKNTNKYTIEKEEYDKLMNKIKEMINNIVKT